MKPVVTLIACMLVLASFFSFAGCKKEEDSAMVGAYGEERDLTEEDLAVFETATWGEVGITYEPLKVSTQVVAGTNYRFYCKATPETEDGTPYYVYLTIFRPLDQNEPPEITGNENVE